MEIMMKVELRRLIITSERISLSKVNEQKINETKILFISHANIQCISFKIKVKNRKTKWLATHLGFVKLQ